MYSEATQVNPMTVSAIQILSRHIIPQSQPLGTHASLFCLQRQIHRDPRVLQYAYYGFAGEDTPDESALESMYVVVNASREECCS
jgi:hypothetical protein